MAASIPGRRASRRSTRCTKRARRATPRGGAPCGCPPARQASMPRRSAESTATSCLESAPGLLGTPAVCAGGADGATVEVDGDPECRLSPKRRQRRAKRRPACERTPQYLREAAARGSVPVDQLLKCPSAPSSRSAVRYLGDDGSLIGFGQVTRRAFPPPGPSGGSVKFARCPRTRGYRGIQGKAAGSLGDICGVQLGSRARAREVTRWEHGGNELGARVVATPALSPQSGAHYGVVGSAQEPPKMSVFPNRAGQSCSGAGCGALGPPLRNARQASMASQCRPQPDVVPDRPEERLASSRCWLSGGERRENARAQSSRPRSGR